VARFAHARAGRFLAVALIFGIVSGVAVALCFARCLSPVLSQAVAALPDEAAIRNGELRWPANREPLLGANSFISLSAAPELQPAGTSVDFAVLLASRELVVQSLLGAARVPYPRNWTIELSRRTVMPLWGAWSKPATVFLVLGGAAAIMGSWVILALPYALVVSGLGAILGKDLHFAGAWKMSVAAQWPGALLMSFMLGLYALSQISLVLLAGAFVAHFAVTVLYLFFAPIFLPQAGANPFSTEPARTRGGNNPFGGGE
jgi:hypothetical protein